jgi:hypothetical protein
MSKPSALPYCDASSTLFLLSPCYSIVRTTTRYTPQRTLCAFVYIQHKLYVTNMITYHQRRWVWAHGQEGQQGLCRDAHRCCITGRGRGEWSERIAPGHVEPRLPDRRGMDKYHVTAGRYDGSSRNRHVTAVQPRTHFEVCDRCRPLHT